jgi:hypothetical protein
VLVFLVYIYTGVRIGNGDSMSAMRRLLVNKLLTRRRVLFGICLFLLCLLVPLAWVIVASETIAFTTDLEENIEVLVGNSRVLGVTSKQKPLTKRLFSGEYPVTFRSDGYSPDDKELYISCRLSNAAGAAREYPVELRPVYSFVLRSFRYDADERKLTFTLDSTSRARLTVEDMYVRVVAAYRLGKSTFPYWGEGATREGDTLVEGRTAIEYGSGVGIKPEQGRYLIKTPESGGAYFGKDIDAVEYRIAVSPSPGYSYKVCLELDWYDEKFDTGSNLRRYRFEDILTLNIPGDRVESYRDLIKEAKEVKALTYNVGMNLIQELEHVPERTILWSGPFVVMGPDRYWTRIPPGDEKPLADLVGVVNPFDRAYSEYDRPRNFLLIDGRTLILQSDNLHEGQIIKDPDVIGPIERAFDELAGRLVKQM